MKMLEAPALTNEQIQALEPAEVLFKEHSENRKIGNIAMSYTIKETCPDACAYKNGGGCYAEGYPVSFHWDNIGKPNKKGKLNPNHMSWDNFVESVRALPEHQYSVSKKRLVKKMFRHNVAGDLPGINNEIDRDKMNKLVDAASHINAFTFTHKPVGFGNVGESPKMQAIRARNTDIVKDANSKGFTVNLSANNPKEADYLKSLDIGPVVTVIPMDAPKHSKTPMGNHVIVCPNEDNSEIKCEHCGLCANSNRKAIIGFRAHGAKKHKVTKTINKAMNDGKVHLGVMQ